MARAVPKRPAITSANVVAVFVKATADDDDARDVHGVRSFERYWNQKSFLARWLGWDRAEEVSGAIYTPGPRSSRLIAARLAPLVKMLRAAERKGGAQSRFRKIPARIEIADVAMEALEVLLRKYKDRALGPIFAALLGVDAHRRTGLKRFREWDEAASLIGFARLNGVTVTTYAVARHVGADKGTVSRWRRDPRFIDRVEWHRKRHADYPERVGLQ